jgi:hypothetical protein
VVEKIYIHEQFGVEIKCVRIQINAALLVRIEKAWVVHFREKHRNYNCIYN